MLIGNSSGLCFFQAGLGNRVFFAVFIAFILLEKGVPSESGQSQGLPEVVLSCLLTELVFKLFAGQSISFSS